jgi:beta-glucosidase/6-phospho-beta-glucosidase/beta-galactosidase
MSRKKICNEQACNPEIKNVSFNISVIYIYCKTCKKKDLTFRILMTGTADFLGLNFYTAHYGKAGKDGASPSTIRDSEVVITQDPGWVSSATSWFKVRIILPTNYEI